MITHFGTVFLGEIGLTTLCINSMATKTSSFLVLVFFVIIPHFEAVFFTEKVLINTYQIFVATETLYQFRWLHIFRQYFLWEMVPPSISNTLPQKYLLGLGPLGIFWWSHFLRQSNWWGMELQTFGKNSISTRTFSLCDFEIVLRLTHLEAVFLEVKYYF